jgi:poly(3-hydroxybutyrate) depolymerase
MTMLPKTLRAAVGLAVIVSACAAALVAAETPEFTPGKVSKLTFTANSQQVTYYIFVPRTVATPGSAPLLVLFHGSGRDGASLVEPWKKLAEKEGIVLVAPNARDARVWQVPADGPVLVCSLVDELKQRLPIIDPRRVYMFGHSAGAVFVLNMAMLESQFFAAAALHAGAYRTAGEFAILDFATRQIPLAITVGDSDPYFALKDVNATVAGLKKAFVPVTLQVIKNHDHNYYGRSDAINAWAWSLLKDERLDEAPQYILRVFR